MARQLIALVVGAILVSTPLRAQVPTAPVPERPAPLITIEVEASRPKLEAGQGISIVGTVTNISNSTVYLREVSLAMTLPVELEGARNQMFGYAAYFPTEFHDASKQLAYHEYFRNIISLGPGDKYVAYWTSNTSTETTSGLSYIFSNLKSQIQFLFFYPGDYKVVVAAKYWTDPKLPDMAYRTTMTTATLSVNAPLFVILFGAAVGGWLGYCIFPKRPGARARLFSPRVDKALAHVFA